MKAIGKRRIGETCGVTGERIVFNVEVVHANETLVGVEEVSEAVGQTLRGTAAGWSREEAVDTSETQVGVVDVLLTVGDIGEETLGGSGTVVTDLTNGTVGP